MALYRVFITTLIVLPVVLGAKHTTTTTSTTTSASSKPTHKKPNYWFGFGDSYTAIGFNYQSNLPSDGNPIGNPHYPGLSQVGGPVWIEFAATVYNKSQIYLYDYAVGGATTNSSLVAPYSPAVPTFVQQVQQFLNVTAKQTPWNSQNSLFSTWMGINDIGGRYFDPNGKSFNNEILASQFNMIQQLVSFLILLDAGARHFLWNTIPPVQRTPYDIPLNSTDISAEQSLIVDFNTKLKSGIKTFKQSNPAAVTYLWDAYTVFNTILDDPQAYGFDDAVSFGGPNDFWGNNYHPSPNAHAIFGQDVANVLAKTIW